MSTEIELGQLRAENARMKSDLEAARKEAAKYRTDRSGKLKEVQEQLDAARKELETLGKERAKLAKQIDELPKETQAENERLKGEIRTGKYRAKFDEIAKEAKADPRALDSLWKLAEVKAETDEIDLDGLKSTVVKTLEANPYMQDPGVQQQPQFRQPQPGPGGGQGARPANVPGTFRCTEAEYANPVFVQKNYKEIQSAAVAGTLTVVPTYS